MTRRELLLQLGTLSALMAGGLARAGERLTMWRNWSGGQTCIPAARLVPKDEADLAGLLRSAQGTVRPVGAAHSFSALVPTEGTLLSLGRMSGLISHDTATLQAEFWAGTPMSQMGAPLWKVGQALPNMADIDYQTLGGAIATSTHGTGIHYGSYSSYVSGLRLVTAKGEVMDCDANRNSAIFNAARVSLGALGLVTRLRLQNVKPYRLHDHTWVQKTEELLEDLPRLIKEHEHFEIAAVLVHSGMSVANAMNTVKDGSTRSRPGGGDIEKGELLDTIQRYLKNYPDFRAAVTDFAVKHLVEVDEDVVDDSYKVYPHVRDIRFNEMEYSIPADAGPACLREVLKTIREHNVRVWMPLEYRYVKSDNIPLSMFYGRDSCSISVHQYYDMDYHNYFALIEPIFWKYEGRPHWGKLHNLNHRQFAKLYPQWKEFAEVRAALDPTGKLLNGHLRTVFGV